MDTILNQIIHGLMLGVMYSLVAVGFTLFFGVLNLVQFAHGEIFMVGAFLGLIILNVMHAFLGIDNPAIAQYPAELVLEESEFLVSGQAVQAHS